MRYALIENGIVANVVEVEEGDGSVTPQGCELVASETASPGDTYNGTTFAKPSE